jgi:hypothetical protein
MHWFLNKLRGFPQLVHVVTLPEQVLQDAWHG